MKNSNIIKQTVQFAEQTTIPKEQSGSVLFDILAEEKNDNASYCKVLIEKLLTVPYENLPDFFTNHCNLISDPING